MNESEILHVLRNPWGHSADKVRKARLAAADLIEELRRQVEQPKAT